MEWSPPTLVLGCRIGTVLDEDPRKIDMTSLSDMTEPHSTEEDAAATTAAKKTRKTLNMYSTSVHRLDSHFFSKDQ
jgi:hypothetical protein